MWPRPRIRQWHYVIVSLRDSHPVLRSYRIVEGPIEEEPVIVAPGSRPPR